MFRDRYNPYSSTMAGTESEMNGTFWLNLNSETEGKIN